MRNMGFRLAAGSVKTARCRCARRRVVLAGSAASSTIVAGGNGSLDLNKGIFLSRTKGDIFIEARQIISLSLFLLTACAKHIPVRGMVVGVNASEQTVIISHRDIP